ncbi:MAG: glycoside hydrolase family 2 TIM barrel-domain containing protein [Eubacteriales bacterium]|nr:glycoside hydrolase family 2 TIM barrel-domain containing protein [Eubacteriales bacterium]
MQRLIPFNREWWYKENFLPTDKECSADTTAFAEVELPHTNKILPYNCLDEQSYQFVSCYKKIFHLDNFDADKIYRLEFEGAMIASEIFLNGSQIGQHKGGYTPFTVELNPALKEGENILVVKLDSTERADIPPFGGVVDYLAYGGIYREVNLRVLDSVHIERLFLDCPEPLAESKKLNCRAEISAKEEQKAKAQLSLFDASEQLLAEKEFDLLLEAGENLINLSLDDLRGLELWSIDDPVLYRLELKLETSELEDLLSDRFGFRKAEFKADGFYLNGDLLKLLGLNRHQSWPYVGYAMPRRVQRKDAEIIKQDLGCNIVRTSHYPQSKHFLDACDELGLLVLEEMPGWQFIGDQEWQDQALEDIRKMITRDYNRPSIILWGVRINESQDNHEFYSRTNALSRQIDPTRQTGGIRYWNGSELLEDVYTYNDFSHSGGELVFRPQQESTGLDYLVPTLVTESNGHMFPTKSFDHEYRVVEHAMRHLRVINEAKARTDLAGGISWCAFDYNTHGCFGSGDKICYHGVCDMFRNPKYAAFAYASQRAPENAVMLEVITRGCRGEFDGGGTVPFTVLTNCDFIRVHKNGSLVGDFYPDHSEFKSLDHPPIIVKHLIEADSDFGMSEEDAKEFRDFLREKVSQGTLSTAEQSDLEYIAQMAERYSLTTKQLFRMAVRAAGGWGDIENDLLIQGFIGTELVIERRIGEAKYFEALVLEADDAVLQADGPSYDASRVKITAIDNMGNPLAYIQDCVELEIEGPGRILGPKTFPLLAGTSAFWIATTGEKGTIKIRVKGMHGEARTEIKVE